MKKRKVNFLINTELGHESWLIEANIRDYPGLYLFSSEEYMALDIILLKVILNRADQKPR